MDLSDLKNVKKARKRIAGLLKGKANIRPRKLERLAKALGWQFQAGQGDEPRYVHKRDVSPLTIPNHPGALKPLTAKSILQKMDAVLFEQEEELHMRKEGRDE